MWTARAPVTFFRHERSFMIFIIIIITITIIVYYVLFLLPQQLQYDHLLTLIWLI